MQAAKETFYETKNGKRINMSLVGTWSDLGAYYKGSDGNYWYHPYGGDLSNCGEKIRNCRGKTLDNQDICSLPSLA
jgi:hypothetical protein